MNRDYAEIAKKKIADLICEVCQKKIVLDGTDEAIIFIVMDKYTNVICKRCDEIIKLPVTDIYLREGATNG